LFNALVFVAMAVGAYIALNMVGNDYDIGLRNFAEAVGKILAVWAKGARDRLPAVPTVPTVPALPDVSGLLKRKA